MKKMTRNEFLKMAGTSAALVVFNTVLMPAAVAVEPGVVALSSKKSSIIVLAFGTVQHLFEHLFPVHAVDKGNFHSCQLNVGRDKVNTLIMVQDALTGLDGLVIHSFLHEGGQCGG